jgi:Mg2+/Co2+ transporter CorB
MFTALAVMLFLSAFFSGTETALMRLNRYRLRHQARSGHRGARLAEQLLARPDRLIGVILLGNNLVNIAAAQLVTFIALQLGGPWWVAMSTFLLTLVVLIFAEVTPKTLAALQPERVALPASFVYYPLLKATWPLVWAINMMANGLLRLLGVRPEDASGDALTIEELRTVVAESSALLPSRRHAMLLRILELQDITVDDVMVPHNEIVGLDLDKPWPEIVATIRDTRYTRLPVYRDSIDNVVGLLNLRRLVKSSSLENLNLATLNGLLDEPYFVPESTPLNRQLLQFQRDRQRTGFVVDEYGDIQGIVTMEDILEEIVGKFDTSSTAGGSAVRAADNGDGYLVNGSANVRALNRTMKWQLPLGEAKTLNGLIQEQLEAIPDEGTPLMLGNYPVEILETGDNVVKLVRLREPVATSRAVGEN